MDKAPFRIHPLCFSKSGGESIFLCWSGFVSSLGNKGRHGSMHLMEQCISITHCGIEKQSFLGGGAEGGTSQEVTFPLVFVHK